jgi:hypothetical protein
MDDKPQPPKRLTPARPHSHNESAGYLPKIPWRYTLLGTLALLIVIGGYLWKERQKAVALRASIVRVHETQLAPAREAYVAARAKLERLIIAAANAPPDDFVDPRFHLPGLRSGSGIYMRIPLADATSSTAITKATNAMQPDTIPSCLGLAPVSARGLYETGAFLLPEFIADLQQQNSVMHLRVQDDVLSRHIRADLPSIMNMIHSQWFMLVLEEGENRRDAPVRAYLWDLAREQLLLRARVRSQGILITSHILSKGLDPERAPQRNELNAVAANDCSIAGAIKKLTLAH